MPLTISRTVEQNIEPLTLAELKAHMNVTITTDDDYIRSLLLSVRDYIETVSNRQFNTATLVYALDTFPSNTIISIPRPPLQSITSIIYTNTSNVLTTLAVTEYGVDTLSQPGRVYLLPDHVWPSVYNIPNAVKITYLAGWASPDVMPKRIKLLMASIITHMYLHRASTNVEACIEELPYIKPILWSIKDISIY